ncbi:MAG: hypothetical protein AB1515_02970 [Nitrospirota bacterium]
MLMGSRHLYSPEGHWVAFLVGEDLFWRDGERLGWLQAFSAGEPPTRSGDWRGGVVKTRGGTVIGMVTDRGVIELWPQALSQVESLSQQA